MKMYMFKKFRTFATLSVFICLLGYSYGVFAGPIQDGADHILTIEQTHKLTKMLIVKEL
ncbi:hypothetical protein [Candidatus Scalindua japonica]|uniref:hypothetical protein n=1 Tax=Candidatus Scalindua japonica TaxID=1284222 RepID=UPI0013A5BCE4|nr:hypothetical protein [Candidatus Scalindua japonica]